MKKEFDREEFIARVLPNTFWRHNNGNDYKVLFLANTLIGEEDRYPLSVVYQNVWTNTHFVRRADDWDRSMTFIGKD